MHQYVERMSNMVISEELFGDAIVRFLYSHTREHAPKLFELATSARISSLLGFCNFDLPLSVKLLGNRRFLARCGVDLSECVDGPEHFDSARKIFERRIRYWACRPMEVDSEAVVSPADARMLAGSLSEDSPLFLKGKFFDFEEILGAGKEIWKRAFEGGDYAIFRLTPDKYHYNHLPVSGTVVDFYEVSGQYHSCNPSAVVEMVTPFSKNRRVVTVIDTDVTGGSSIGLVAMVEVVALMIGDVVQCYSDREYLFPEKVRPGMFLKKGQPKSLYRPGSSTDILFFQKNRMAFCRDIIQQMWRRDVISRFSLGFGNRLAEIDVAVRSTLARKKRMVEDV
jgi:phosphatidylserine decarboxylase